jgi:hypothetical protein
MEELYIPNEYLCPLTLEIMIDPVLACDGHTYERDAILQIRGSLSPMTRQPIDKTNLIPNRALKNSILRYNEELQKATAAKLELEREAAIRKAEIEAVTLKAEIEAEELLEAEQNAIKAKEELLEAEQIAINAEKEELEVSIINQKLNVITEIGQAKQLKNPSLKHMFYITSSLSEISILLEGTIDDPKKFIKTLLFEFYEKTHIIDIDILEIFNESLKGLIKQEIKIDEIIEIFSIINMDGSFLLMFESIHIKLVLHEFIKLVKYIF